MGFFGFKILDVVSIIKFYFLCLYLKENILELEVGEIMYFLNFLNDGYLVRCFCNGVLILLSWKNERRIFLILIDCDFV